jgi:hypothetical protein
MTLRFAEALVENDRQRSIPFLTNSSPPFAEMRTVLSANTERQGLFKYVESLFAVVLFFLYLLTSLGKSEAKPASDQLPHHQDCDANTACSKPYIIIVDKYIRYILVTSISPQNAGSPL